MNRRRVSGFVSLGIAMAFVLASTNGLAASLILEKSQEWKQTGDTVAYDVHADDADGDGTVEILTAGSAYMGSLIGTQAQLRIWNWNDNTNVLTLEKSHEFSLSTYSTTVALSVFAGDVDGDGDVEILTAGYAIDGQGYYHDHLVIWQWNDNTDVLTQEVEIAEDVNSTMRSVFAYDVDGDGLMEIAAVGENSDQGIVWVFNWNGTSAAVKDYETWGQNYDDIRVRSVFVEDVDADGTKDIVTGGYFVSGSDKKGEVRLFTYSGGSLSPLDDESWRFHSDDTEIFSVFAGVLYSGGGVDIVACGSYDDAGTLKAGVQVLEYVSGSLGSRDDYLWLNGTATECHGIYAAQITGSGDLEILAAGYAILSGIENGQIFTFNYNGTNFNNKEWTHWYTDDDTQAQGDYALNVDGDADVEILSAGQAKDARGDLRGQLRIWHWS